MTSALAHDRRPALKRAVHRRLLSEPVAAGSIDRAALRLRLEKLLRDEAPLIPDADAERVLDELVVEVDGLGPLEALLADPLVTEIMLNGPGRAYIERSGRLEPVALDLSAMEIVRLAERIIAPLGLRLDRSAPMADARLADGSRLHAVLPPLAPDGPCLTIRRFATRRMNLSDFGAGGAAGEFLATCVRGGANILVAGATSAGKTTLLNVLSGAIDGGERIVTIEETAELRLAQPHVVRLEARPANGEGVGAVSVRQLVRAALRMRPDRVVVGEVRGAEALDMLQALNTGHDGSMCTLHANSAADALSRLETLVLFADVGLPIAAVRSHIGSAIDLVVFVTRGADGSRHIDHIAEVGAPSGRGFAVHRVLTRHDGVLRAAEAPARALRRAGHNANEAWQQC
ncbi:MAG: Flp pilus assembly protein ATPase CpaF [Actinomycetia bacterium]|nr:Flp pilus assembly protein ATPase CpaF [Actinomycetes bacterium]